MSDFLQQSSDLPERFGPYRRVRELGRGAMGAVFEVVHEHTGARYALKVILPNALGAEALARFRREAEAMSKLSHPNVARIHGGKLEPPIHYLVLDLYPGHDLKERMDGTGVFPIPEAQRLVAKMAAGLAHAHAQGVLHRDLKPANVLFDAQGEPVLSDFGLARTSGGNRMTHTGELLGTPLYMAPEQVIDGKRTGPEADVYALGAMLYRLLTGRPPIQSKGSVIETLQNVVTETPRDPAELRPELSPELALLCRRTLAKEPSERPTAAELAEALAKRPPPPAKRSAPRAGGAARNRGPLLAGLSALTLCVAGGLVWATRAGDPPPPTTSAVEAPTPPRGAPPWLVALDTELVTLTVSTEAVSLSILAKCSVREDVDGGHTWLLHPRRVRAWNGSELLGFVGSPRAGASPESRKTAAFMTAPLSVAFDEQGELAVRSPAQSPASSTAGPLEELVASLDGPGLQRVFEQLLATPVDTNTSRVARDRVVLAAGELVGAVWSLPSGGWASLLPTPVGRVATPTESGNLEIKTSTPPERRTYFEGLLLATNGLSDPDGETSHPERGLAGQLELPFEGADTRLRGVQPPYTLLTSSSRAAAYTRPWGTTLGAMLPNAPYLQLEPATDGWIPIAWQGGEAWVEERRVAHETRALWVGLILTRPGTLNVRMSANYNPEFEPRLGSLRTGQVVPTLLPRQTRPIRRIAGNPAGALDLPAYDSWIKLPWGPREAYMKASIPQAGGYALYVALLRANTPSSAAIAHGEPFEVTPTVPR